MNLQINRTAEGVKVYPLHKHNNYEIMLYLKGTGYLCTKEKNYPFTPGTIIIVPPYTEHGSASREGFENISVGGEFNHLLSFSEPVSLYDNENRDGKKIAETLYDNRFGSKDFLAALTTAYILYLLQNTETENDVGICVRKIVSEISENAFDCGFIVTKTLSKSGYAEDYIRSRFKKITGKTPVEFLTDIRIKRACFLMDIYKDNLSLSKIAEQCGYADYSYFSKKFKSVTGISPAEYKNQKIFMR